jgi:hypothetical protein
LTVISDKEGIWDVFIYVDDEEGHVGYGLNSSGKKDFFAFLRIFLFISKYLNASSLWSKRFL